MYVGNCMATVWDNTAFVHQVSDVAIWLSAEYRFSLCKWDFAVTSVLPVMSLSLCMSRGRAGGGGGEEYCSVH